MRVRTTCQGGLAVDCRTNVYFKKDDFLEVGYKGLLEEHLQELIDVRQAVDVTVLPDESDEVPEEPEYKIFTEKDDLSAYAKETYEIDLDKRKSIEGMTKQLEDFLEAATTKNGDE